MSGVREIGCGSLAGAVLCRNVRDTGSFVMVSGLPGFSDIPTIYSGIWRRTNYAAVVSLQYWNNGSCGSARLSVLPLCLFRLIFLPDSENPFHIFLRSGESVSRFIQCAFEILCGYAWYKQKHTIHTSDSFLPVPVIELDGAHVCLY